MQAGRTCDIDAVAQPAATDYKDNRMTCVHHAPSGPLWQPYYLSAHQQQTTAQQQLCPSTLLLLTRSTHNHYVLTHTHMRRAQTHVQHSHTERLTQGWLLQLATECSTRTQCLKNALPITTYSTVQLHLMGQPCTCCTKQLAPVQL